MHTHTSRILSSLSQDGTDPWNIPKVIIIFFSSSLGHGPCACRNGFLSPFWWILRYVAHVTLQGKAHCSSCCCQPLVIASATELPCRSHATFWGGLYLMADRCGSLMSWASRPILGQFWMAIPAQTTPPPGFKRECWWAWTTAHILQLLIFPLPSTSVDHKVTPYQASCLLNCISGSTCQKTQCETMLYSSPKVSSQWCAGQGWQMALGQVNPDL